MTRMKRFTLYRRGDLSKTHSPEMWNSPNEPQLEGVVFTDGTVVVRWLTIPSTSVWRTLDEFLRIHGHLGNDEYCTEIVWHDAGDAK